MTKHQKFISPKYDYLKMSLLEIFEAVQKIVTQFRKMEKKEKAIEKLQKNTREF